MGCLDLFWVFIKINFLSAGVAQLVERNLREFETRLPLQIQKKGNTEQFPFFRMWSQNDGTGRRSGLKIRRP